MIKIRGIYDGTHVRLLDPVSIPPDTEVEVLVPGLTMGSDDAFRRGLIELGLVEPADHLRDDQEPFTPIPNPGEPISETIIRERH